MNMFKKNIEDFLDNVIYKKTERAIFLGIIFFVCPIPTILMFIVLGISEMVKVILIFWGILVVMGLIEDDGISLNYKNSKTPNDRMSEKMSC